MAHRQMFDTYLSLISPDADRKCGYRTIDGVGTANTLMRSTSRCHQTGMASLSGASGSGARADEMPANEAMLCRRVLARDLI